MVIYSCFVLVSALRLPHRGEAERTQERETRGGRERKGEGAPKGLGEWGVVWTQEVQRGGWVHCEDTTSLIMPSQSTLLLTGSPCKAHLP